METFTSIILGGVCNLARTKQRGSAWFWSRRRPHGLVPMMDYLGPDSMSDRLADFTPFSWPSADARPRDF